jgi:cysteine-rich repeat protein
MSGALRRSAAMSGALRRNAAMSGAFSRSAAMSGLRMKNCMAAIAAALALLGAVPATAGTPAATANDVCASTANPCVVNRVYDVAPNAVLDFGTRSLSMTGAGQFNFGKDSGRIQCGDFAASTTGAAFNLAGPLATGGTSSGSVLLLARRRCSATSPVMPCLDDAECQLGPCGVRRCSLRTTRTCQSDADCNIGVCNSIKRCSNSTAIRCATNADCDYGTCPAQLTCTGRGDSPVSCSTNGDCAFGTCSIGTASVLLDGPVAGSSDSPASFLVRAADNISVYKPINLNGTTVDSDGGSLTLSARGGTVTLAGKVNATGGGFSGGGSVEINSGADIVLQDDIDVNGGDFDGGSVDLTADRDLLIGRSLLANSNSGAGFGGDLLMEAGRDVSFTGVSASNKSTIEMNGHTDISNSAGDGGALEIMAGRNLTFDANTRVIGNGSAPDGSGSDVLLEVGANAAMHGDVVVKSVGIDGSGGYITVYVEGSTDMGTTSNFDATGGSGGGGFVEIDSASGDLAFDGTCSVNGGTGGSGGGAYLSARQAANVAGDLTASGTNGGDLTIDACRVTLESGAGMTSSGAGGTNTLVSHDTTHVLAGSAMSADASGLNRLRYRNPARPPVVQGSISPSPTLMVDPNLSACPLCGNRALDAGESCDDGNMTNGDGCNAECQNERCISQTPGYPTVALCEDGNPCTDDVCAATAGGTCTHPPKNCNDGISCTEDSCDASDGTCRHASSDALCNDSNPCTDDFCSMSMGCANTANSSACDDSNRCTENDICASKVCRGTRINGCLFCGDDYYNPFGGEQCDDGNVENGDCCSSTCQYEAANSSCEDGLFCTIQDTCNATGTCITGVPNTCADTDVCTQDACDEELAACINAEAPRANESCMVAPNTKLQIKNATVAKRDKLAWQWNAGDGFLPAEIGTPQLVTGYTLCVYDTTATTSSLGASIDIAPSEELWTSKDPSVFQYKDKLGSSDGVTKVQIRAGEAGETKVKVGAAGANLALPAPIGASYFRQDPSVVVQLINGANRCWTSQFTPIQTKTNDAATFKAATK